MNRRRKLTNALCSVAGFIALGASAFGQQADKVGESQTRESRASVNQLLKGDYTQTVAIFQPGLRVPAPQGNGFCQLGVGVDTPLDGAPSRNATTFNIVDNFRPAANGNLTSVSFSGHYRRIVGTTSSDPGPVSGTETWLVRIYKDDGAGTPSITADADGFPRDFTLTTGVNVTRSVPIASENVIGFGNVTFQVYNYVANLGAGQALRSDQCYWIQVTNITPSYFGPAATATDHWRINIAAPTTNGGTGDNYCYQSPPPNTTPQAPLGQLRAFSVLTGAKFGIDWQMCYNLVGSSAGCNQRPPLVVCPFNSVTDVAALQPNCNVHDDPLNPPGPVSFTSANSGFVAADNFSVSQAQITAGTGSVRISSLCFNGVYTGQITPPADEQFEIRIFRNSTSGASFPDTSAQVGSTIITNGSGATPGVTIGINNLVPSRYLNYFRWTVNLPPAVQPTISAAGCYWLQIRNTSSTSWGWIATETRTNAGNLMTDGYCVSRAFANTTFAITDQRAGQDLTFCLSFAPVANTSCLITPAATNITCAAGVATPLTIGAPPIVGQTINAAASAAPPTILSLIDQNQNSVWYTIQGNGSNITLSLCSTGNSGLISQTNYNTVIAVYCGTCTTSGTDLRSVAYNDNAIDTPANPCLPNSIANNATSIGASRVTFPSTAGVTYYVLVQAAGTTDGFFWINATTSALGAVPPSVCANIIEPPCIVSQPAPGPNVLIETEACIQSTTDLNPNNSCQTATQLPFGTLAFARMSTGDAGTSQDRDFYQIPDSPVGGRWVDVEIRCEAPLVMFFFAQGPTLTCPATGDAAFAATSDSAVVIPPCLTGVVFQQFVQEGNGIISMVAGQFNGLPCSLNRNRYTIRVTPSAVGACCVGSGSLQCVITTRDECTNNQPTTEVGVFTGAATCTPAATAGCDVNNNNNTLDFTLSFAQFGACCGSDGSCTVTIQAACPTGVATSWTASTFPANQAGFTPLTVCLPAPNGIGCPAVVQRCCFTDGTCRSLVAAACTALGAGFTSSPGVCLPNTCPLVPTFGCCNAGGVAGCTVLTMAACTAANGTVQTGFPGTCTGVTCPALTVPCCLQGICSLVLAADCTSNGGTVQGAAGTTCTGVTCPAATGLCCAGSICRQGITQAACVAFQATAQWTANAPGTCPAAGDVTVTASRTPCCKANYNHTGARDVNDIFAFLADWFARRPAADFLGNGANTTSGNVQNIFAFLTAWFAAGCT